jgi:hypothetical protein
MHFILRATQVRKDDMLQLSLPAQIVEMMASLSEYLDLIKYSSQRKSADRITP